MIENRNQVLVRAPILHLTTGETGAQRTDQFLQPAIQQDLKI